MYSKCVLPWHDDFLLYTFQGHPFSSKKYQIFKDLVQQQDLAIEWINVTPIEWQFLEAAIGKDHLHKLQKMSETGTGMIDPATPAFKNMLYPSRLMAQATYLSIKEVLEGHYAFGFNVAGGLHHATPNESMGGCVLNDMGVAITKLQAEGQTEKIAILDFDYHPHNGTVAYFGGDGQIFTASIHEAGWFNNDDEEIGWGPGLNTVWNKGVKKMLSGDEYLRIVQEEMLPRVRRFKPDLIIMLNGVDPHQNDPVVAKYPSKVFALTDADFALLAQMIGNFAREICQKKLVILGAGGYSSEITPRIWNQTLQILCKILL